MADPRLREGVDRLKAWLQHAEPKNDWDRVLVLQLASSFRVTNGTGELAVGQRLMPGRITFESGMLEILLSNGVTLLQEGPGELELISPMRTRLHNG